MPAFERVIDAVSVAIQIGVPTLLTGPVGDAKTSIVESIFSDLCDQTQTCIAALYDPPQFGGYPVPTEKGVALLPVDWVRRLARADKRAGLFLDEFANGAPATRSAAMRGVLDGVWGDTKIPKLSTVAAMNPVEYSESGYELSAPLANRFLHIDWDMPVPYWTEKLLAGFPTPRALQVPDGWRERKLPKATAGLAAFAKAHPASIKQMPAEASERSKPFPSLRSFTVARDCIAACEACGFDLEHDTTVLMVSGLVGPGAAIAFLNYTQEMDIPDPETLLANPDKLVLPTRGDRCFATLSAVVAAIMSNNTIERWNAGWKVLQKAVGMDLPDVAAMSARTLAANMPRGARLPKELDDFLPILDQAGVLKQVG